MSFSYSYLAARCEIDELQAAFLAAWPAFELVAPAQHCESWDSAYRWAEPRCGYLQGRHPDDVKLLFRNNTSSVLADISMCMADDVDALAELSRRVGRIVAATTQGTAGYAQLLVFEAGKEIRSITGQDGRTTAAGTPLAEEAGIGLNTFYLDEIDAIWQRLGLSSFLTSEPAGPTVALHVVDRTPYPEVAAFPVSAGEQHEARRPWWQFR